MAENTMSARPVKIQHPLEASQIPFHHDPVPLTSVKCQVIRMPSTTKLDTIPKTSIATFFLGARHEVLPTSSAHQDHCLSVDIPRLSIPWHS